MKFCIKNDACFGQNCSFPDDSEVWEFASLPSADDCKNAPFIRNWFFLD